MCQRLHRPLTTSYPHGTHDAISPSPGSCPWGWTQWRSSPYRYPTLASSSTWLRARLCWCQSGSSQFLQRPFLSESTSFDRIGFPLLGSSQCWHAQLGARSAASTEFATQRQSRHEHDSSESGRGPEGVACRREWCRWSYPNCHTYRASSWHSNRLLRTPREES